MDLPNDQLIISACPHCGRVMDRAASIGGEQLEPQPGDRTVCVYCGKYGEFDAGMRLQRLGMEAFTATEISQMQLVVDMYRRAQQYQTDEE